MSRANLDLLPLSKVTSTALRHALSSIGARASGNKILLLQRLQWEASKVNPQIPKKRRIISIDMGIRNLAFAVCDVHTSGSRTGGQKSKGRVLKNGKRKADMDRSNSTELVIHHWTRLALDHPSSENLDDEPAEKSAPRHSGINDPDPPDPYHPAQLSITAANLVHRLLSYEPDVILVERQRHRSGGGSAIQEWTVRVNSLESMIWSGLRMWASHPSNTRTVEIAGINPAAVASFWVRGPDASLTGMGTDDEAETRDNEMDQTDIKIARNNGSKGRRKIDKKDKITVAAFWARMTESSSRIAQDSTIEMVAPPFTISFEGQAQKMRDAFLARLIGKSTRSRKSTVLPDEISAPNTGNSSEIDDKNSRLILDKNKLDDLADCLLQAGAWVAWEDEKRVLAEQIRDEIEVIAKEALIAPAKSNTKTQQIELKAV